MVCVIVYDGWLRTIFAVVWYLWRGGGVGWDRRVKAGRGVA